jgi:hypothetical protein
VNIDEEQIRPSYGMDQLSAGKDIAPKRDPRAPPQTIHGAVCGICRSCFRGCLEFQGPPFREGFNRRKRVVTGNGMPMGQRALCGECRDLVSSLGSDISIRRAGALMAWFAKDEGRRDATLSPGDGRSAGGYIHNGLAGA